MVAKAIVEHDDASVLNDDGTFDAVIMAMAGTAVLGGLIGGIVGSGSKSERWKEVGD